MCKIRSEFTVVNIRAYILLFASPTRTTLLAFFTAILPSVAFTLSALYINGAWNNSPFPLHILQYPQRKIMH